MDRPIALKEWAVAVEALERGEQIVVLRKGGIAEETSEFRLESPRFYLHPTYEHQKPELIKPAYRDGVGRTQAAAAETPGYVKISSYAEATDDIEIQDEETLRRLGPIHIWTDDYAAERLKWKKTKPLHLLLLRVYRLPSPALLPIDASYGGCKSWHELLDPPPAAEGVPALEGTAYEARVEQIRRLLLRQG